MHVHTERWTNITSFQYQVQFEKSISTNSDTDNNPSGIW